MSKVEEIEKFVKLTKEEKNKLTLSWLTNLIKTEHLSIEDVIDILNCVESSFSKSEKLESLLINGTISVSSVSRLLGYGYTKSVKFIQELLKKNVITQYDTCYKIIDKENFKKVSKSLLEET